MTVSLAVPSECHPWCMLAVGSPGLPGSGPLAVSTPGFSSSGSFAIATLVSWLVTEAFGALMLAAWLSNGGHRRRDIPGAMPRSVIFSHAGLAFTGLLLWTGFVITGAVAFAWLSVGFLAPAIGLGISTVTLWTPYPTRDRSFDPEPHGDGQLRIPSDEKLAAALEDEALTTRLIDDLVASALDQPAPQARRPKGGLTPLIPAIHGIAAMVTVLLAVLAAVTAS